MWGSLARNITSTVGDAVKTTASTVAPTAGDVLRRVGEVVAPTEEYSSDESEYESGDGTYEDGEDEEDVDFEDDNLLDRYRKGAAFLTSPFRSGDDEEECKQKKMNGSAAVLDNQQDQQVDTDQYTDEQARLQYEQPEWQRIEQEAEQARLKSEQLEQQRLEEEAAEQARLKAEQLEQQRLEEEAAEQARLKAKQLEQQRLEEEAAEKARLLIEAAENHRLEEVRKEADGAKKEAIEAERLRIQQEEAQAEQQRLEKENMARQLEEERLAFEKKREEERLAKAEQDKIAFEKKREADRLAELKQQELKRKIAEEALAEAEAKRQAELKQMELERKKAVEIATQAERERMALDKKIEEERLAQKEEEALKQHKLEVESMQHQAAEIQKNQQMQLDADESHAKLTTIQRENETLQSSNQQLRSIVDQLKLDLHRAAEQIAELKMKTVQHEEDEKRRQDEEALRVEQEEAAMVQSVKSDMERQITQLRDSLTAQIMQLESELEEERKSSIKQQHELQKRLEEATSRLTASESEMTAQLIKKETALLKQLQASEKAASKAVSLLDQKEEEVQQLQSVIADMRETMKKSKVAEDEAEEEMDELHHENEELHAQLEVAQKENLEMKAKLARLADDSERLGGLKMEMQLLEEERQREKALLESANEASSENFLLVSEERDAAKARVQDLEQQLAAAHADVDIANSDKDRALLASENLQRALEAIQSERDSEIALLLEQRNAAEEAMTVAHNCEIESLRQTMKDQMQDIQYAADKSVQNSLVVIDKMEATIQECRRDNLNLRRALDEAISRLQTSQEDVIDRNLIKNIILDWHAKKGKAKRDVMILLGSILHFTEDEKDKAYISDGPGALDKVVNAVAAPLPASKLNVDKIEGDNIRDKWVNFLLAETGDDEV